MSKSQSAIGIKGPDFFLAYPNDRNLYSCVFLWDHKPNQNEGPTQMAGKKESNHLGAQTFNLPEFLTQRTIFMLVEPNLTLGGKSGWNQYLAQNLQISFPSQSPWGIEGTSDRKYL